MTHKQNTSPEKKPTKLEKQLGYTCDTCHGKNVKVTEHTMVHFCEDVLLPISSPTHDQVQWKKAFDEKWGFDEGHVMEYEEVMDFFLQTLQHLHDEAKEKKTKTVHTGSFHETIQIRDYVIRLSDLQAIFTRYGVGDKL